MSLSRRQLMLEGLNTELKCWTLYVETGWGVVRIAREIGISQGAVSKALKRAERKAFDRLADMITAEKALQAERLHRLYTIAMDAYDDSVSERRQARTKRRTTGGAPAVGDQPAVAGAEVTETQIVTEHRLGNPRYLELARKTLADLRDLFGLNAPARVQVIEPDRPYADLTQEQLQAEAVATLKAMGLTAPADLLALPTDGAAH